jgi:uncharacterized protein YbjQ (UPF0145 family)
MFVYYVNQKNMILTTTATLEGKKIINYIGIVTGDTIMGANVFKDIFASVRDIVGGRSATYEKELGKAREIAVAEMIAEAQRQGANAIIGIDYDYETVGAQGSMLMVNVTGTAVIVE